MGRTTPPPPLDVTGLFPELAPLARPAVRLHPRSGSPGIHDSSLGGPLLWPADEDWPVCHEPHRGYERVPAPPGVTTMEQAAQWAMATPDISMAGWDDDGPIYGLRQRRQPPDPPVPLVGIIQLFASDLPELPFPEDTDLLQVLWCPNDHEAPWYGPCPVTVWRRAGDVTGPRDAPPPSRFDDELFAKDYVPGPCVVHPERVTEYPHIRELPAALSERIERWDTDHEWQYEEGLSTAPGTKVGGHPHWIQDPQWPVCRCGRRMHHLLTVASDEFGDRRRWLPLEDRDDPALAGEGYVEGRAAPHGLMLGDVGSLYLFTCPACTDRPLAGSLQSS